MPSPVTSPLRQVIAANLDRAIKSHGLTNRAVGDLIGATEHQVWRWRRGKQKPSEPYAIALTSLLFGGEMGALYIDHDQEAA